MTVYSVKTPDGEIVKVNAPEGTPKEKIFEYVSVKKGLTPGGDRPPFKKEKEEQSFKTPSSKGLPSYDQLLDSFKLKALDTLAGDDEVVSALLKERPDIKKTYDDQGNLILISPDGKMFNANPPIDSKDVTDFLSTAMLTGGRSIAGKLGTKLLSPALKEGAENALIEAGLEGAQTALGGDFDKSNVALAGGVGALTSKLYNNNLEIPKVKQREAEGLPISELIYEASGGSKKDVDPYLKELAQRSDVDPEAKRIYDSLGLNVPEVMTSTNPEVLEEFAKTASIPGSGSKRKVDEVFDVLDSKFKSELDKIDAVFCVSTWY